MLYQRWLLISLSSLTCLMSQPKMAANGGLLISNRTNHLPLPHPRKTRRRGHGISISLGHTDTDSTTCLHVPSIGLAVCGDALYNDVHLHLGESNAEGRKEWIAALDRSSRSSRWPLLPDTRGPAHPIRQITSRRHENTFAISTGRLPIPRPRSIYTMRCLRFIPNA